MPRSFPLWLALALAACSARELEEEHERPSHRHLASQWCEDWCAFWQECAPMRPGPSVHDCRDECEADEWWDWTDECGDLKWELHECLAAMTCEEALDDPDVPGSDTPCQSHFDELLARGCTYA